MDNVETQLMQDSQDVLMSPISKMPQFDSQQPAAECAATDDAYDEESDESEEQTEDEEVEVVQIHDDICIEIEDESESVLSPKKPTDPKGLEDGSAVSATALEPTAAGSDGKVSPPTPAEVYKSIKEDLAVWREEQRERKTQEETEKEKEKEIEKEMEKEKEKQKEKEKENAFETMQEISDSEEETTKKSANSQTKGVFKASDFSQWQFLPLTRLDRSTRLQTCYISSILLLNIIVKMIVYIGIQNDYNRFYNIYHAAARFDFIFFGNTAFCSQDRKPLVDGVEIPQSLADQAKVKLDKLSQDIPTTEEHMAEIAKALWSTLYSCWIKFHQYVTY